MKFNDRSVAGRSLATALESYRNCPEAVVLALPRGGVPVGFEVARELALPLDVFIVRKLGTPGQEELALGAIASGGTVVVNEEVAQALSASRHTVESIADRERIEVVRQEQQFRGDRPPISVSGKTVILIDDGLATGATMRAAVAALRAQSPSKIVVAVPVAAAVTYARLRIEVDEVVCLHTPEKFYAVGEWYRDFSQTTDKEVRQLLDRAWKLQSQAA